MQIELNDLLKGKATKIKNKEYFSTEQYITPFLDRMSKYTDEFLIQVKPADQISLTPEGDVNFEDIIYNRVNIEAVLPDEYCYEGHKQVVGFIYALDTRKPVVKIYAGTMRSACLNLAIFNPELLKVSILEPESAIDYTFVQHCMDQPQRTTECLNLLKSMQFSKERCCEYLGQWIDNCINSKYITDAGVVKLAESIPIEAYKNVFYNEKSDYYTSESIVSGFDIYQSFTYLISNSIKGSDITNRFEKSYLVAKIMNIL